MEEEIEVVAFACRGTLLDWSGAIEAVAYELARCNGESPLDRGAALRRRVEALADGHGLARGFERLARERGYRGEESGEESLARVVAMARPLRGAREVVALAVRSGRRLVAVSRAESPGALYLFGGAFEAVSADLHAGRGAAPERCSTSPRPTGGAGGPRAAACAPWRPATSPVGARARGACAARVRRAARATRRSRPDERARRPTDLHHRGGRRLAARTDPRRQDRAGRPPARSSSWPRSSASPARPSVPLSRPSATRACWCASPTAAPTSRS